MPADWAAILADPPEICLSLDRPADNRFLRYHSAQLLAYEGANVSYASASVALCSPGYQPLPTCMNRNILRSVRTSSLNFVMFSAKNERSDRLERRLYIGCVFFS